MKYIVCTILMIGFYSHVDAGAVLTNKKVIKFGEVTKSKKGIRLKVSIGETVGYQYFKKDVVIYYTTNKKVVDHYTAAKQAYIDKKYKASKFLAKVAAQKEPKNRQKAKELIMYIDNLGKIKDPLKEEEEGDDYF